MRAIQPRHGVPGAEPVALLLGGLGIGLLTAAYVRWLGVSNPTIVALSFLLVVLIVAAVSTWRVAVSTSLLAFVCFNFFFLPPVRTFTIADPQNWVALFTLLAVSVVASHLSSQARRRAQEAMARRDELARLFDLTRDILLTTGGADAMAQVARSIADRFRLRGATICLPGESGWQTHGWGERPVEVGAADLDGALRAAGAGHRRIEGAEGVGAWLVPLRHGTRLLGLLALHDEVEPGTRDAIAGVTAIAIERTHLLDERKEAEVARRGAELKSALLASLSHDLKTPLTAVTVAANNLNASGLTEEERREQADIVRAELERLNRLFEHVVDLARIEANAVSADPEWVQAAEIADAAAQQVEHALARHTLEIDPGTEKMLVRIDPRLTSAALAHLLENAGQYSPPGSTITVKVSVLPHELQVAVRDRGPGVTREDLGHLFERFYRGADARQQRFGTGMGLAITRGLLAAEGGRVWAENHLQGGAVFTLAVPAESREADALDLS